MLRLWAILFAFCCSTLSSSAFAQTRDLRADPPLRRMLARERIADGTVRAPGQYRIGHVKPGSANDYGPYHVGAVPIPDANNNGVWDWDSFHAAGEDSLQGWWPIRRAYSITGGITITDIDRAWWAADIGNQGNYVSRTSQAPSQLRTMGVVSYWHVDGGASSPGPGGAIQWSPLSGMASAWCGLRAHGDNTWVDPLTGNPYNQTVLEYNGENGGGSGTNKHFPGYAGQWDQLLYRDVIVGSAGATLDLSFLFCTRMSTQAERTPTTRTGWYNLDPTPDPRNQPLCAVPGPNGSKPTFYSNTGTGSPCDSFMVYIGVPVDVDNVYTADGALHTPGATPHGVYDLQRRWFSEVLDLSRPIVELMHAAGNNNSLFSVTGISLASIYNSQAPAATRYLRIVFRSKTNRGSDDESGGTTATAYHSGGEGAVRIDDVTIGGTGVTGAAVGVSGFEAAAEIDNSVESNPSLALAHWHGTGRPPGIYFHPHPVEGGLVGSSNVYPALVWQDLCGRPGASPQFCNMGGNVISAGDHDHQERVGNVFPNIPENEVMTGIVSPTINLVSDGTANSMGVTGAMGAVSDDYYLVYDVHAPGILGYGVGAGLWSGLCWTVGAQSYPAIQSNGITSWGELRVPAFQIFDSDSRCLQDFQGLLHLGLIRTSNPDFTPDSLRVFLGANTQCFRFGTGIEAAQPGLYFDNVSLSFADVPSVPEGDGAISMDIARWLQDAFPAGGASSCPDLDLGIDTLQAFAKSGLNIAQSRNASPFSDRLSIAGDSMIVVASDTVGRVDLVFRILPGPGAYHVIGNRTSGLRPVPTDEVSIVAPGSGSFWGAYLADNGSFGTPGGHVGGVWNPNVWNSARVDTGEINIFPVQSNLEVHDVKSRFFGTWEWMATYHEADPKYATLGISHNRCFLTNPTTGPVDHTNTTCNSVPSWVGVVGVANAATGWDGNLQTKEGTKIIPDGLLTPGAHVQYFFRSSELAEPSRFRMCPDTHFVSPQNTEGPSTDGHRWQEFSVLPDRWKSADFGGSGMACMLLIDLDDRRGDDRVWTSVMDSIGGTSAAKRGANNGWKATGAQLFTNPVTEEAIDVSADPTIAVYTHGGQAGTVWDKWDIKAAESLVNSSGSIGASPAASFFAFGKDSRSWPKCGMLEKFYRVIVILTGDLNVGILGPFRDRGANDIAWLENYLSVADPPGTTPRLLYIVGDGFAESELRVANSGYGAHLSFLTDYLRAVPRTGNAGASDYPQNEASYPVWSGDQGTTPVQINASPYSDLDTAGPLAGNVYGLGNSCLWGNDVLSIVPAPGLAVASGTYSNVGTEGPYISGVYRSWPGVMPGESVLDGWDIRHLFSRWLGGTSAVKSTGRLHSYLKLFTTMQAALACASYGTPVGVEEDSRYASALRDYLVLRNNPVRTRDAVVRFGLAHVDRVLVRIYDVSGRLVRTLANRMFTPGEYELKWDGVDDTGSPVAHGVYFAQARYINSGFVDAKRVVMIR